MKSQPLHIAELYDNNPMNEPLLSEEDYSDVQSVDSRSTDKEDNESIHSALLRSSLWTGVLFGAVLQVFTLVVNSTILFLWQSHRLPRAKYDVLLASLLWSCSTGLASVMAAMALFRKRVERGLHGALSDDVTTDLEARFVIGAVSGICLGWTALDIATRNYSCITTTLLTFAGALASCQALLWCYSRPVAFSHQANNDEVFTV